MKALVFAAGKGERLRPITEHTPKPLVKVKGLPLLHHHLLALHTAGIESVVINVSWLKQQIIDYVQAHDWGGLRIQFSIEPDEPLETGGGMLKALPLLGQKPFLVVNADVFTDFDFQTLPQLSAKQLVHLVLVNNPEHNPGGDFGLEQQQLLNPTDNRPSYTYAGIGLYRPQLLQPPFPTKQFSIVPFIRHAIKTTQATAQIHHGDWHDVGTIERLNELTQ